jgi:hypothetical protein
VTSYDGGGEERSTASAAEESTGRVTAEVIPLRLVEGGREVRSGVRVEILSDDCLLLVGRKWQTGTSRRLDEKGTEFCVWLCLFLPAPVETIGLLDVLIASR